MSGPASARQSLRAVLEEGAETRLPEPVDRSTRPGGPPLLDTVPSGSRTLTDQRHDLFAPLPDGVALLQVSPGHGGAGHFTMSWHAGMRTLEAHDQQVTVEDDGANRSIAQIMRYALKLATDPNPPPAGSVAGDWHTAYLRAADSWSGVQDLGWWISSLRSAAAERAHVIIWDTSGADIPWELYYGQFGTDEYDVPEDGWLGVTVPVTRWVGRDPRPQCLPARRDAIGGVLLFDDGQTHKPKSPYQQTYSPISHVRVGDLEVQMDTLLDRLEGDEAFGLLVIRGHGVYDASAEHFTMAGLPLFRLTGLRMQALARNGPTVLLGLCSSGRTFVQNAFNRPIRSFVEPFVRRGASCVIAVMAEVDITHLQGMIYHLVREAESDPVVVAEWLRRHRASYYRLLTGAQGPREDDASADEDADADQVEDADEVDIGEEELYRMFLTSCLFVCYGHPHTTLRVRIESDEAEVEAAPAIDPAPSKPASSKAAQ